MYCVIEHGEELPEDPELVVELTPREPTPPFRRSYVWSVEQGDSRFEWYGDKAVAAWGVASSIPYRVVIP